MKLLFLTPPMENWMRWGTKHVACNPLHAQLAAYVLQQNVADVAVLDCRALGLGAAAMVERVKQEAPNAIFLGTRLVTDGGATPLVRFIETMALLKESFPQVVTILGGLGASAMAKEILTLSPQVDYILLGEAELTLAELLSELQRRQPNVAAISGLAYRLGSAIRLTAPRALISDLDELPVPAYELFPMDRYVGFSSIEHYNEAVTSRGCEGACNFCYEWGLIDPRRSGDFFVHRTRSGKLVAGTDLATLISTDGGAHWKRLGTGLPVTTVMDLHVGPNSRLYAATHGRGIWSIAAP